MAVAAAPPNTAAAPAITATAIQRNNQTNENILKEFEALQEKLPQYVQATSDLKAYVDGKAAGGETAVAKALTGESPATKSKRKRAAAAPQPTDRVTRSRSPKKAKK
jgi:hypothetical protein